MKATIDPPRCPLHFQPMRELPALPDLKVGPKATGAKVSERRQFNAFRRFRCVVPNCPRVEAVPIESTPTEPHGLRRAK